MYMHVKLFTDAAHSFCVSQLSDLFVIKRQLTSRAPGIYFLIILSLITPPPVGGRGIVFARFLCFFLSLFLCQQDYEKTTGPICMKFSGKVWSDNGTTDYILGQFG